MDHWGAVSSVPAQHLNAYLTALGSQQYANQDGRRVDDGRYRWVVALLFLFPFQSVWVAGVVNSAAVQPLSPDMAWPSGIVLLTSSACPPEGRAVFGDCCSAAG